jgi:hypothetical protein
MRSTARALRVLNGELIYRGLLHGVTPGYYTVAWLFRIFGEQLMVLRWGAVTGGHRVDNASRGRSPWSCRGAALMTAVWGWLVAPNYSWEAALFSMIALACYVRARGARRIQVAGIAAGCAAMVKQNIGAIPPRTDDRDLGLDVVRSSAT